MRKREMRQHWPRSGCSFQKPLPAPGMQTGVGSETSGTLSGGSPSAGLSVPESPLGTWGHFPGGWDQGQVCSEWPGVFYWLFHG